MDEHFSVQLPHVKSPLKALETLRKSYSGKVHELEAPYDVNSLSLVPEKTNLIVVHLPKTQTGAPEKSIVNCGRYEQALTLHFLKPWSNIDLSWRFCSSSVFAYDCMFDKKWVGSVVYISECCWLFVTYVALNLQAILYSCLQAFVKHVDIVFLALIYTKCVISILLSDKLIAKVLSGLSKQEVKYTAIYTAYSSSQVTINTYI